MDNIPKLLSQYSTMDILVILIMVALSLKGCISFFDWVISRTKKAVHKSDESEQIKEELELQDEEIKELKAQIKENNQLIHLLLQSDKDDIKAFITRQHHYFCYQKEWIDDYSLDCIEQRYTHYKDEGGNSFISSLMKELRALPKQDIEKRE